MIEKLLEKQRILRFEVLALRDIIKKTNIDVLNDFLSDKEMELKSVSQDLVLIAEMLENF